MTLLPAIRWLSAPANHDIIARRTRPGTCALELPAPPDPERLAFLVLGDTGDSDVAGTALSPQDAVARELAIEAGVTDPPRADAANLVLHLGDVVYMTGERRLYERNFRRPYAPFLTRDSTFDRLVFRVPFLPVPGNHDYYDFPRWAALLAHVPVLGLGFRALARELFAFSLPSGGSDMGHTFMDAFLGERDAAPAASDGVPLRYEPGRCTRIPNRYYQFRCGPVEFFALDSNTLDGLPPAADAAQVRAEATRDTATLERRAAEVAAALRNEERTLGAQRVARRRALARDPAARARLIETTAAVATALVQLEALAAALDSGAGRAALRQVAAARGAWQREAGRLAAGGRAHVVRVLGRLDAACTRASDARHALEGATVDCADDEVRRSIDGGRDALEAALTRWRAAACEAPDAARRRAAALSEEALELERRLARERRRRGYRSDDWDAAQLAWLDAALDRAVRERPDGWRVAYLHHPLWTSMTSYAEIGEIQEIRDNLLARLRGRVHAVFCGHAHAFEWLRVRDWPETGVFVSGGGGQVHLGRSVLDPARRERDRPRAFQLAQAGVQEAAIAGRGPAAGDGHAGPLYHFLRVEVTPECLRVRPIGVRRLRYGYRRETPMPVWHAAHVPDGWQPRLLDAVEIVRGAAPRAVWRPDPGHRTR